MPDLITLEQFVPQMFLRCASLQRCMLAKMSNCIPNTLHWLQVRQLGVSDNHGKFCLGSDALISGFSHKDFVKQKDYQCIRKYDT